MVTYVRTSWVNGSGTPLDATNLNNIEQGIVNVNMAVTAAETAINSNAQEISAIKSVNSTQNEKIDAAEKKIGVLETGLGSAQSSIQTQGGKISSLETTVGGSDSGLVKSVTDLQNNSATKTQLDATNAEINSIKDTMATDTELESVKNAINTNISNIDQRLTAVENSGGVTSSVDWNNITNKPTNGYTPTAHTHSISEVDDLESQLATKAATSHSHSSASSTASGFMTATQYNKLAGIEEGANNYELPEIVNNSEVTDTETTISFSIGERSFSQVVAVDGGSLSVGSADRLTTSRNITLVGDVTGSASFDGSTDVSITATVADDSHTHSSYVNQNAFSNVTVDGTTITADTPTDTITFEAGENITLTPDATNDKITISAKDTTYSFSANNPTLSWGSTATIGSAGGTTYEVTMPANPNTDTKVTSVGNHYTPSANSTSELTASASDATTSASWDSTNLVTGVNLQRDAKGHVTGVTVNSIKMPANPDTNTTYSGGDGITISSDNVITNSGIRALATGVTNGHIAFNKDGVLDEVAVKGLGSAAYTESSTYATAAHAHGNIASGGTLSTASAVVITDSSKKITTSSTITTTELDYLEGVTSNIQSQLDTITDMLTWKSF